MATTIESFSTTKTEPSMRRKDPSLMSSNTSSNDLSVSSLVQKWRGFEAEAKPKNQHYNNMITTNNVNMNVSVDSVEVSRASSGVSISESTVTNATIEDRVGGGERELIDEREEAELQVEAEAPPSLVVGTIGRERERMSVADIVRKWASDEHDAPPFGASLARLRIGKESYGGAEQSQRVFFSPHVVVCSPRIRGRQAIANLFLRMERERYNEVNSLASRHAVSKFPQRGRIQSLLRLRFLRRELVVQEQQWQPCLEARLTGSTRPQTTSSITNLREKFSTIVEQDSTKNRSKLKQDTIKSTSNHNKPSERINCQDEKYNIQSSIRKTKNDNEPTASTSTSTRVSKQPTTTTPQPKSSMVDSVQKHSMDCCREDIPFSYDIWEDASDEDVGNLNMEGAADTTTSYNDWKDEEEMISEEQEFSSQQYFESNLNWISDIARPRSYWEDCRQARYQEVLNTKSKDEEIRRLLERGSVSSILASDFRDRMDHLVLRSVHRAMHLTSPEAKEEDKSMSTFLEMCTLSFNHQSNDEQHDQEHVQENTEDVEQEVEDGGGEEEENEQREEEEEVRSSIHQYHDGGDYYDRTPSLSQVPWDHHYQDREANYDSDHGASTNLQQPSPVPSYDYDTQGGSSFKNSSIEMEIIYDLREHMVQLYREMSELRKSITSCMDMQMKLQNSIREEVSVSINHTERVDENDLNRRHPKKGCCCVCYEKKVNSLLYRCGHMCTCFKCAHELQWSSRKCPICRAQIVDVVRSYSDR